MKYAEILRIIYGNDIQSIITAINSSLYVSKFKSEKDSLVVNTGFIFRTQKKEHELYYDIISEVLIRQPKLEERSIPQLNGLISIQDKRNYFNLFYDYILTEIPNTNNIGKIYNLKDARNYLFIKDIKEIVVKKDNREYTLTSLLVKKSKTINIKYPYFKNLTDPLFYDGNKFSLYNTDSVEDPNSDYWNNSNDNDIWDGDNPWPGLDPCDWRGG